MKAFEIELRGPLSPTQYATTLASLRKNALLKAEKHRLFIDYTTMIEGETFTKRTLDIRARITNNQPELMIKQGSWGENEARREIGVQLKEGEFSNLVKAMAALGYNKGILCIRDTIAYTYNEIEIALVTVPAHSYFFELEIMVEAEDDKVEAHKKLQDLCRELSLTPFRKEEFYAYMEKLNKEANKVFDIEKDGEDFFKKQYKI